MLRRLLAFRPAHSIQHCPWVMPQTSSAMVRGAYWLALLANLNIEGPGTGGSIRCHFASR
jgi:hypothetical protein